MVACVDHIRGAGNDSACGARPDPEWLSALECAEASLDHEHIEAIMDEKRGARDRAIDALESQEPSSNRMMCTIMHDSEHAALTTNLQQLAELGVVLPNVAVSDGSARAVALTKAVALIACGLAKHDVYLTGTDHLDDAVLYEALVGQVLHEPVRDVPGGALVHEWIDLSTMGEGSARERWLTWYASDAERDHAHQCGEAVPPKLRRVPSRDAALPRPQGP